MRDENRRSFGNGSGAPFGGVQPRRNGAHGVHPENIRPRPFDEFDEPIDLVAVQADDELINALAAGMSVTAPGVGGFDADDQVASILAAWKAEVDAAPIPELVDLDTAVATVVAGRPPSRRARHLAPVAAAAAFIVLAVGGVSVGSATSEPGDALWAVSKVLYSERAESVEAADRVETHIAKAKQALVAGEPVVAAQELAQAGVDLAAIRPEEGGMELAEVQNFLIAKAQETPAGTPTDPGAPLVSDRARKVPAGAAVTADPSSATSTAPVAPVLVPPTEVPAPLPSTVESTGSPTPSPSPVPAVDPGTGGGGSSTTSPEPSVVPEGSTAVQPTAVPGQSMGGTEGSAGTTTATAAGAGDGPVGTTT